jgi:hypothetical protein
MVATTFTFAADLEPLVRLGGIAAVAAATLTLVWLVVMVAVPAPPIGSTGDEELSFITAHDRAQIVRFLPTTLVAFAYIPTWLGVGVLLWESAPAAAAPAVAFGVLYPATTATGYWMQYTVVRGLAAISHEDRKGARAVYEIVGFHDRPTSLSATLVILGYATWSCAGLASGIGLIDHGGGLAVTTGVLLLITAGLMFIGVAGHITRRRLLELGVVASGVVSLGATISLGVLLLSQV